MGRADLKVEAIEKVDQLVLGPMLEGLKRLGEFRLLLMPDHPTPCKIKTHSNEPVPFAIVDNRAIERAGSAARRYTEADAAKTGVIVEQGYRLIEALLGQGFSLDRV